MFIFLARSWASDRVHLSKSLAALGDEAEKEDQPFCFVLYPEGTLVSENTRPISKKFADKIGVVRRIVFLQTRCTLMPYSGGHETHSTAEIDRVALQLAFPCPSHSRTAPSRHDNAISRFAFYVAMLLCFIRDKAEHVQGFHPWVTAKRIIPSDQFSSKAYPLPSFTSIYANLRLQPTSRLGRLRAHRAT